jgi:hypothetical protein
MRRRRTPVRGQGQGAIVVVGWILAGASVVSSTAAVAMSAAALRRIAQPEARAGSRDSTPHGRVRITAVGDGPRVARVPPLHAVAPVPPENPHAPPTPPLGNPAVRR